MIVYSYKCNRNLKFCALLKKIHISILQLKVNLAIFKFSLQVEIFLRTNHWNWNYKMKAYYHV